MTPKIDVLPLLPELFLGGFGVLALFLAAARRRITELSLLLLSLMGLAAAAAASLWLWSWDGDATVLGRMIYADRFTVIARLLLLAVAAYGAVYGFHYFARLGEQRREFFALLLFCTLGMTLITAAADLLVVFLALEILSLSLYVLVGFSFRAAAGEASMKYFLLGAFSSAFFLYGVAMAYGATGSTNIATIALTLTEPGSQAIAMLAVVFLLVGFCFKVAAVPFHMWTPDVYQGAPTPVTAFMSAATKVAAFMALIRVLDVALQPMTLNWVPIVVWLAGISVVVGSVLAIAQTDVKRMLAYSSIAHAGFVLTALTAPERTGIQAAMFYLVVYSLMTLGSFGVVMLVAGRGEERTGIAAYQGLARRSPALAALMTIFMLSLAGIPPTAGFLAKFGVFQAAVSAGHWPLALVGVLSSVVAAFFYLRIIVLMYMTSPAEELLPDTSAFATRAVALPAALLLVFGVFPGLILPLLEEAAVLRW